MMFLLKMSLRLRPDPLYVTQILHISFHAGGFPRACNSQSYAYNPMFLLVKRVMLFVTYPLTKKSLISFIMTISICTCWKTN